MEIRGKRVLITGASRGIGEALARRFAAAGAQVALVARSAGPLEVLAKELDGTVHPCDLTDGEQLRTLVERVEDEAGPVDVLVNNAGIGITGALVDLGPDAIDSTMRLNLIAPLELCRQAVPRMLARGGGHLVTIGSLAAVAYVPGMTAYAASKAGVVHGTEALRQELKGLPVGVTTVLVGGVPTELLDEGEDYEPFHLAFERLRRTQLTPDTPADKLAVAVVRGVERDEKVVYLPKRALPFVAASWFPRRFLEAWMRGIPVRA